MASGHQILLKMISNFDYNFDYNYCRQKEERQQLPYPVWNDRKSTYLLIKKKKQKQKRIECRIFNPPNINFITIEKWFFFLVEKHCTWSLLTHNILVTDEIQSAKILSKPWSQIVAQNFVCTLMLTLQLLFSMFFFGRGFWTSMT